MQYAAGSEAVIMDLSPLRIPEGTFRIKLLKSLKGPEICSVLSSVSEHEYRGMGQGVSGEDQPVLSVKERDGAGSMALSFPTIRNILTMP